jgi:hypothetical protein
MEPPLGVDLAMPPSIYTARGRRREDNEDKAKGGMDMYRPRTTIAAYMDGIHSIPM